VAARLDALGGTCIVTAQRRRRTSFNGPKAEWYSTGQRLILCSAGGATGQNNPPPEQEVESSFEVPVATGRYVWVAITLALGLLAKPMLVTWPFVMLLLDYWPLGRFDGESSTRRLTIHKVAAIDRNRQGGSGEPPLPRLILEKLPLFALVTATAVVTTVAQSRGGAVRTFEEFSIPLRLSNALVSYAKYLLLAFWPHDLALFYPFPAAGIPAWQIIGAALLLIGITVFCFLQSRKHSGALIVGWLWFLGTLVPVIGLVQVGKQTISKKPSILNLNATG